jgi:ectoine hydroxylase-related dioxygenase (phytanoyl-CoA dioxygenase family)
MSWGKISSLFQTPPFSATLEAQSLSRFAMPILTSAEQEQFWRDGWLFLPDAIDQACLSELRRDFNHWVEESRSHSAPYGQTIDARPRFDVEPGHNAAKPALRRVNSPTEISSTYYRAMSATRMTNAVADLIGPNVKFHHSKINSKLPGAATAVKWHQDFPFTPHSNDDIVTALLFIDEVTGDNGPLELDPGTHKGEIFSLWKQDVFTAAVSDEIAAASQKRAVRCCGPAGGVCFMHTRVLHGSGPNRSSDPRTLFISVFTAEDAVPLAPNPLPSEHEGLIVHGRSTGNIRSIAYEMRLPQKPSVASFFGQQSGAEKKPEYGF